MDYKDIGILVTFLLGLGNIIYNLYISRRTTFINSVTAERVKWLSDVRGNISSFAGLTHHWVQSDLKDTDKSPEILKEIDRLRYLIMLQLNPKGKFEHEIIELIGIIPNIVLDPERKKLWSAMDQLVSNTQSLLKEEWEKVKREAGRL